MRLPAAFASSETQRDAPTARLPLAHVTASPRLCLPMAEDVLRARGGARAQPHRDADPILGSAVSYTFHNYSPFLALRSLFCNVRVTVVALAARGVSSGVKRRC